MDSIKRATEIIQWIMSDEPSSPALLTAQDWDHLLKAAESAAPLRAQNEKLRTRLAALKISAIQRDGGTHDADCAARLPERGCRCGHDELMEALGIESAIAEGGE